jgi:hypothetical protein
VACSVAGSKNADRLSGVARPVGYIHQYSRKMNVVLESSGTGFSQMTTVQKAFIMATIHLTAVSDHLERCRFVELSTLAVTGEESSVIQHW